MKKQFTLIELLVVIGIIAVLASMLMPALGKAQEKARQATCMNQLKQFSLALSMFRNDNKDKWPSWLSNLYPDYVDSKKLYQCPADRTSERKEANNVDPHPYDSNNAKPMYDIPSNHGADDEDDPNIGTASNQVPFDSYLYQMCGGPMTATIAGWFGISNSDEYKTIADGKEYQLENGNNGEAYDPTIFPVLSCFWHAKKNKDKGVEYNMPTLQVSYAGNFFMSYVRWDYGQWVP